MTSFPAADLLQFPGFRTTLTIGWCRMFSKMTPRVGYFIGFLVCAGLLAFALYLQYYERQDPCPLCILQRVAFVALMVVFLVAALHGPGRMGSVVYSGMLFVVAGIGAAIATRHVWLQHLPKDQVPECGPGLEYMLKKFPLSRALGKILSGSGECAEAGWSFFGLTIAGWSLVWFVLLGIFATYLALLALQRRARG
jgi:disulfide bond formation protein DsbB